MQPWASLIVMGAKKIETKSWNTPHRGPLLIHANATDRYARQLCSLQGYNKWVRHWTYLPYGSIIGMVHLQACEPVEDIKQLINKKQQMICGEFIHDPLMELQLGNFSQKQYGWILSNARQFSLPIVTKGKMKMWDFDYHPPGYDHSGVSEQTLFRG